MGSDAEPIRHLQSNRVVAAGGGWVTFEDGELRARAHHRRCGPPGNGIRSECVSFVRMIFCGSAEWPRRPGERASQCEYKQKEPFHDLASVAQCRTVGIMS